MAEVEIRNYAEYQKYNFFRVPQWRWDRVLNLVGREPRPGRCTHRDDERVRAGRNFLLNHKGKTGELDRDAMLFSNPGLFYAYDFYERQHDDPEAAMFLESRLLADQPYPHIAHAMGITVSAVDWYESMFFNVKDKLPHRDWITKQVLLPAMTKNPSPVQGGTQSLVVRSDSTVARAFLDGSLKLFAYFGGTHVVDVMIAGFQSGKPVAGPDALSSWYDNQWAMTIRRRSHQASLQFEVNKYNVMELFAIHTKIIEIDRSEESQESIRNEHERTIKSMIDEIPWAVGMDGAKMFEGKALGEFDDEAAELRDEEVIQVAAGDVKVIDDLPKMLPPPRKKAAAVATKAEEL